LANTDQRNRLFIPRTGGTTAQKKTAPGFQIRCDDGEGNGRGSSRFALASHARLNAAKARLFISPDLRNFPIPFFIHLLFFSLPS